MINWRHSDTTIKCQENRPASSFKDEKVGDDDDDDDRQGAPGQQTMDFHQVASGPLGAQFEQFCV